MTATLDMKRAAGFAGVLTAALGAAAALPVGSVVVAASCIAAILKSPHAAVAALFVFLLLRIGNPALTPPQQGLEPVVWLGVMLACGRVWLAALGRRSSMSAMPPHFLTYLAVLIPMSALMSTNPTVSLLKAVSFAAVATSLCVGFGLTRDHQRPASSWIKGLWLAVVMLSVPALLIPSVGFLRDGMGFQGVLNHPQGYAVFLAPVVAWSGVQSFSTTGRGRGVVVGLLVVSLASLFLTRGRTGLAAIALGGLVLIVLRPGFWRITSALALRALSRTWVLAGLALLIPLAIWKAPDLVAGLQAFLLKGSGADGLAEAAAASRGFIVDQQILNFQNSPIFGIGFGVSDSTFHSLDVQIDPLTGLPVGAATEKANLLLAVLEETGIVGALAFAPFFIMLVARLARSTSLAVAWAALAALATNVSEMTFFSMGGVGLYTWLIMAWALSEAPRRTSSQTLADRRSPMPSHFSPLGLRT